MMHLSRMLEERIRALEPAWKYLEFLREKNDSLAQQMKDFVSVNLGEIVESSENVLQQVDHFYRPLII